MMTIENNTRQSTITIYNEEHNHKNNLKLTKTINRFTISYNIKRHQQVTTVYDNNSKQQKQKYTKKQ
jgi:hypothetical protein